MLYVSDYGNHRVQVFTRNGQFVYSFVCCSKMCCCVLLIDANHAIINRLLHVY